jgi:hypothetical protein
LFTDGVEREDPVLQNILLEVLLQMGYSDEVIAKIDSAVLLTPILLTKLNSALHQIKSLAQNFKIPTNPVSVHVVILLVIGFFIIGNGIGSLLTRYMIIHRVKPFANIVPINGVLRNVERRGSISRLGGRQVPANIAPSIASGNNAVARSLSVTEAIGVFEAAA